LISLFSAPPARAPLFGCCACHLRGCARCLLSCVFGSSCPLAVGHACWCVACRVCGFGRRCCRPAVSAAPGAWLALVPRHRLGVLELVCAWVLSSMVSLVGVLLCFLGAVLFLLALPLCVTHRLRAFFYYPCRWSFGWKPATQPS